MDKETQKNTTKIGEPPILSGYRDFDKWGFDVPFRFCNAEDMYYLRRAAKAQWEADIKWFNHTIK